MKKALIFGLLFLFVAAGAFATQTRVLTLGENNNILLDEANIWLYPSRIMNYPNLAVAEVGLSGGWLDNQPTSDEPLIYNTDYDRVTNFGINWKFGEKNPWVIGTYFYNDDDNSLEPFFGSLLQYRGWLSSVDIDLPWPSTETWNEGNQRISLFVGHNFSGYNLGFKASMLKSSDKYEETGNKSIQSLSAYDFAIGMTNPAGNLDVTAELYLLSWKDQDSEGHDYWKPDGNMGFALNGRYFHKVNSTLTFVPNAGFMFGKMAGKYYGYTITQTEAEKLSVTMFHLGCGLNYTPVQKVLGVLDFGVAYTKGKMTDTYIGEEAPADWEGTDTYLTLPYFRIGMEADVFNWMDIRLGSSSYWQKETWKSNDPAPNDDKEILSYPDNKTYLGLGLNFNRLHIDTYTDPQILLHGLNFISGDTKGDHIDMNFQLSLMYEMF